MSWHPEYIHNVLKPDYQFSSTALKPYFVDTLIAHVRTVRRLELPFVQDYSHEIAQLEAQLMAFHERPAPAYDPATADLYYAINRSLEASLGIATVSFLRLGLSRNDLDMTVYRMRARDLLLSLARRINALQHALLAQASEHMDTALIAYTHHRPGQPTSLAHYLLAVSKGLTRTSMRLELAFDLLDECPMGAAALAGSSYPLDRAFTARSLGFQRPMDNTYDAVASSDWQLDLVSVAQQVSLTLSRLICDLLNWASQDIFTVADALTQGSSIMPQKRNPLVLEHARARFSQALGTSQAVVFSSHNLPFGDLIDCAPDVQTTLHLLFQQLEKGLRLLTAAVELGSFNRPALEQLSRQSETTATELADELVRRYGLPFQEAHRLTADLVAALSVSGRSLQDATPWDLANLGGPVLDPHVLRGALSPNTFIERRTGLGGPAPTAVAAQLDKAITVLNFHNEWIMSKENVLMYRLTALRNPS